MMTVKIEVSERADGTTVVSVIGVPNNATKMELLHASIVVDTMDKLNRQIGGQKVEATQN